MKGGKQMEAYTQFEEEREFEVIDGNKKVKKYSKYWNEKLETLPREELEEKQLEDLKEIVKFSYENSPYYRRTFDEAGVKPEDIKTLKDIERFPFINKQTERDTQGVGSFLGELAAVPEEDVVFI